MGIIVVVTLGIILMVEELEVNYGSSISTDSGSSKVAQLRSDIYSTQRNLSDFTNETKNEVGVESGITEIEVLVDMGKRALAIITFLPKMIFQVIPHLIGTAIEVLELPDYVGEIATGVFTAVAVILLAYLLLLGVRRLT